MTVHSNSPRPATAGDLPDYGKVIWISAATAAAGAGNSPRTVKRWIKAGLLSSTRLPSPKGRGPVRIRLGDLESLIARGAMN